MLTARLTRSAGLSAAIAVLMAVPALADVNDLLERVPPGANAIAYMNVESLLNSKLGRVEKWRDMMSDAYEAGPLIAPPDSKQVLLASWLEPTTVESLWEVSVIEVGKAISMQRIARDAEGLLDSLGGKPAAWVPANAYMIRLDKHLLGVVSPADRQFAARWSARSSSQSAPLSPYLRAAGRKIGPKTDYLLALDLEDVISEKRFRHRLAMDEFECLADKKIDFHRISDIVASIKGLTLTVTVGGEIKGNCEIDFGQPVSELSPFAKPLLMEILDKTGASLDDVHRWSFKPGETSITATGTLSTADLRRLCSIINPPSPIHTDDAADSPKDKTSTGAASESQRAAASQRYFKAVSKIVDGFGARVRSADSLTRGATYVARDARNIGRLPILNVDPELATWGAGVSSRMLEVASALGVSGLQARSRAESILNPYTGGGQVSELEIRGDPNAETDRQNAARMRRAAVAEEKGRILQQASQLLLELEASRSQIRAAMTQKYTVNF